MQAARRSDVDDVMGRNQPADQLESICLFVIWFCPILQGWRVKPNDHDFLSSTKTDLLLAACTYSIYQDKVYGGIERAVRARR